jgi:hypothetical protein
LPSVCFIITSGCTLRGEECNACVLTKAKQILVDFGILYDAKLLHVLLGPRAQMAPVVKTVVVRTPT